jgi:hypothetical protein
MGAGELNDDAEKLMTLDDEHDKEERKFKGVKGRGSGEPGGNNTQNHVLLK